MTQTLPQNPTVLALEQLLSLKHSQTEEMNRIQEQQRRDASAPWRYTHEAPENPQDYVMLLLRNDKNAQETLGYTNTLVDVLFRSGAESFRTNFTAGIPCFLEQRFLAQGFAQRELQAAERSGLLTLQVPTATAPHWVLDRSTAEAYGKHIGLIAIGSVASNQLGASKPRISDDGLERAIAILEPSAPEIAQALSKILKGSQVSLGVFLPASVYGAAGRRVGREELY